MGILTFSIAQRKFFSTFKISPLGLICNSMQHAEHGVVFQQNAAHRGRGVNAQGLKFAQQKQPEDVVEIRAGQHNARNRRLTQALAWLQLRRGFDLRAQVRRCTEKKPRASVLRDRNLSLAARLSVECAGTRSATIRAGAIPLRKRTSGRGTENLHSHLW